MTHEHNDHTAGLDDVRPFNFWTKRDIPFYVEQRVLDNLHIRFRYIFEKSYSTAAKLEPTTIKPGEPFMINEVEIIPFRVNHGSLPIVGFRIGNLAYITDAKTIPEESMAILKGVEIMIVNALEERIHPTHFSLGEATELADRLSVKQVYITHMSHRMGRHVAKQLTLPSNVTLGYDTMQIEFTA